MSDCCDTLTRLLFFFKGVSVYNILEHGTMFKLRMHAVHLSLTGARPYISALEHVWMLLK